MTELVSRAQCVATRPRLDGGAHRCPKPATHGEWCRMHAQSLGGWVLIPSDALDAADYLVAVWANNAAIEKGSALWEDIQRLRVRLEAMDR